MPIKPLLPLLLICLAPGSVSWAKRIGLMLVVGKFKSEREYVIAPNRDPFWEQAPQDAVTGEGKRPPNIVLFFVADDLGVNDIPTFGGSVAGGRVQTPNIDASAAPTSLLS